MNIGCLSPWSELRDVYIEKCFEEISVEDVLRRYALQTTDDHDGWGVFNALQNNPGLKKELFFKNDQKRILLTFHYYSNRKQ